MKKILLGSLVLYGLFGVTGYAADEMVERAQNEAELKRLSDEMNTACNAS